MSASSTITTRKTRATSVLSNPIDVSNLVDEFNSNLHSPSQFTHIYNQYYQSLSHRSSIVNILCNILIKENVDKKILSFILDCLITNRDLLSDIQFKQDLLPFIKQIFTKKCDDNNEIILSLLRLLTVLVEYRSNILSSTLVDWLSCLLNFLATSLSSSTYLIYGDLVKTLFSKIVKQFPPLSKDILEILTRSSSSFILSTGFLQQLKSWIQNIDDTRLALFSINLWESLASLLCRLIIRGHTKGNEILAVIEDAFIVQNYSIRSAAFLTWSSFMSYIHRLDDIDPHIIKNRLLKLFLTPFIPDSTSKSKSASISKCQAWVTLISIYPKNINDILLPFLSFAFGNHIKSKADSTTTAWWSECRQIGGQFIHDLLIKNVHSEYILTIAGDQILNYLFDFIVDQLLEYKVDSKKLDENSLWLTSWNAYLNHLMNVFKSHNSITENQRVAINSCLLTRIEQLWIDSRIETRFLLKLFETFEHIGFPLAIETVLRDSSIRTKTLSAAQIHPSSNNHRSQEKSISHCTTLSDQYLHMMLEHAIRFNDEDQTIEDAYLHVISYLIDTLSKTSDENFCYQTTSLMVKCHVELSHQPVTIPYLFWHIWFRCSTNLINVLNRSYTFELNNKIDNQKQDTSIELLLRPFSFNDIQRLDYSYTLLWIQLFKALCRLTLINNDQSKTFLVQLLAELLRNEPAFEQAINDQQNQRLFGFLLNTIKTILKTLSDVDLSTIVDRSNNNNNFVYLFSNTQKRSLPSSSIVLCFTQISTIVNHVLQRLLSHNENTIQYVFVCHCLVKTTKVSSNEQTKSTVFTYIRDLIVDLLNLCKIYPHVEIVFKNLTQLIPFLQLYEQTINANLSIGSSPVSLNKQQSDNVILNKILSIISSVFDPSNSSPLLQLMYPLLILAFKHNKTIMRNKARKCWNETFGRMTFIVYPNELRQCLRELKDKEHLLLPCFLADHDNSNTAGSGPAAPSSNDESQLSQQIDIVTPLIPPIVNNQQMIKPSSPARFVIPSLPPTNRSINFDKNETVYVPIVNNINHNNQSDEPVLISKRVSTKSSCLTEKQKEKLRKRQSIPLLCDDNSNTQSNSSTMDTPTIEHMMTNYQLRNSNKQISTSSSLFKSTITNSVKENNPVVESPIKPNEVLSEETDKVMEDVPEESSIAKKLRRSCRPSMSGRKSLLENARKKRALPLVEELNQIAQTTKESDNNEQIKTQPIKGILKRLSSTKPRQDHLRRVAFHDQVKVLVFASPLRRDSTAQLKRKSPNKNDMKSPTRFVPKENLPLRKQTVSIRQFNSINENEQIVVSSPSVSTNNRTRSSKLFHPNDALADWTQNHQPMVASNDNDSSKNNPIFYNLINCNKKIETLFDILYEDASPTNVLEQFHSMNIITIGDLARSTSVQIETYPIPSPKLTNIQQALKLYEENLAKCSSASPPTDDMNESSMSIRNSSEEIAQNNENSSTQESSAMSIGMITNENDKLLDMDTLMDSLDCDKLLRCNATRIH